MVYCRGPENVTRKISLTVSRTVQETLENSAGGSGLL